MTKILPAAAAALLAAAPGLSLGADLGPMEARVLAAGETSAVVYYLAQADAYQVVTALAPRGGAAGVPVQLVNTLRAGETAQVALGQTGRSAEPTVIRLHNTGAGVSVVLEPAVARVAAR